MTKIVKIVRTEATDDVSVYLEDPTFVVTANRTDLGTLDHLEWGNRPGIYILIGDNKRYVGQASGSVVNRLKSHDKSKAWWEKVIFFGAISGGLDKAKLDYLEALLIAQFSAVGTFEVVNSTSGNESFIDSFAKVEANRLLTDAQNILQDIVSVDLFEGEGAEIVATKPDGLYQVIVDGVVFEENSAANMIISISRFLLTDEGYSDLTASMIVSDKATQANPLGSEKNITNGGVVTTVEVEPGIFVYKNVNPANAKRVINKLVAAAKTTASFNW